ncbi:MAG: ArnT family glycosyltransferase [Anaerolineae bacterium]
MNLLKRIFPGLSLSGGLLLLLMAAACVLHFANLGAIGDANVYYTAAVKSMLQSWRNFFFAAAEPGGSVTVDKPPLGLWVEAAFAFALGVQGWVVSLPNILAGIFSLPLLYHLVKKQMGELAGLTAALVLTVTPVVVATDRNNTMDGMLVFTLLLAAWAFLAAAESGKPRGLFLGAFLLGLGFNIKMLQAFLPLPAFYALYLLGAQTAWWKKMLNVAVSGIILLVVSLAWAVIVDLTPAERRPYIGSSQDNTVMELILGHNGLARLFNPRASNPPPAPFPAQPFQPPPQEALTACQGLAPGAACSFTLPNGNRITGACIVPPGSGQLACAPQPGDPSNPPAGAPGDGPNAGPNNPILQESGSSGPARFFVPPLSKQMSWLLPFALIGIGMAAFAARPRLPFTPNASEGLAAEHKAFVLWGGWLITCLVFFSRVEGIFHAYYTIMLAPPLGAAVGMGMALFWRWQAARPWLNAGLLLAAGATAAFQVFTAAQHGFQSALVYVPAALLTLAALLLFVKSLRPAAYALVLTALVTIPLLWTGMTVLDRAPNTALPTAVDASAAHQTPPRPVPARNEPNPADEALVTFLQAHTQDVKYLVAAPNAHIGAPLVLATGRPVLYMGGFGGGDPVIDAAGLAEMVTNGELRYVLFGGGNGRPDIAAWLQTACAVVPEFSQRDAPPPPALPLTLYRCGL